MFTVTDKASQELSAFFSSNPDKSPKVRIFLAAGCHGPMLNMALDDPNSDDVVEKCGEVEFFMEKSLADQVHSVAVDLSPMGFALTPEVPLPSTGGSCCTGCSGCH